MRFAHKRRWLELEESAPVQNLGMKVVLRYLKPREARRARRVASHREG
jgi:hypothetical protein